MIFKDFGKLTPHQDIETMEIVNILTATIARSETPHAIRLEKPKNVIMMILVALIGRVSAHMTRQSLKVPVTTSYPQAGPKIPPTRRIPMSFLLMMIADSALISNGTSLSLKKAVRGYSA